MRDFAAQIPPDLFEADHTLTLYGRWAAGFGRGARTCGSAEGDYRPGAGEVLQARREAGCAALSQEQRLAAQRALARVPEPERVVLSVLYVPRRFSIGAQLRLHQIPPSLSVDRHLRGLRMWWNLYQAIRRAAS
jgi:hypothetical protein